MLELSFFIIDIYEYIFLLNSIFSSIGFMIYVEFSQMKNRNISSKSEINAIL